MATFTIEFEVGPKTREMVERVLERTTMQLELGPKTRELVESLLRKPPEGRPPG